MLPENQEVSEKANSLDLSKVKIELLASTSITDTFKQQSETLLQEYRNFLALKVIIGDTKPPLMYSPSAIIDQVWHIHLLMPAYYASCCKELGVDMIDHDPSTARDALDVRCKRLEMAKKSYQVVFQKMPPEEFWAGTSNQIRYAAVPNKKIKMERIPNLGSQEWYTSDIEVLIKETHKDKRLRRQLGVVRGVTPGICSVFLYDEESVINIPAHHLTPVLPSRGDKMKVILGDEDKDQTGQLLSIDTKMGVVKLDVSGDVKMIRLKYLCKIKSDD